MNPHSYNCCPKHYNEKHRRGPCGEARLTSYVHRRIEDLNAEAKKREEVIHAQWKIKFDEWTAKYLKDYDELEARIETIKEEARIE